jgi:SAM-dependent methyltransferase
MIWIYILGAIVLVFGFVVAFGAPYVPSHRQDIRRVFAHCQLGPKDLLIDVGSGDGIVLREAAKRGAKAVGYELNPVMVFISRFVSSGKGDIIIHLANFWSVSFPAGTTCVYSFAIGRDRKKLEAKIQSEATRLNQTIQLLCYGNPFKDRKADATFEAYSLYRFQPLQRQKAQV